MKLRRIGATSLVAMIAFTTLSIAPAHAMNGCGTDGRFNVSTNAVQMRSTTQSCPGIKRYVEFYSPEAPQLLNWMYDVNNHIAIAKGATISLTVPGDFVRARYCSRPAGVPVLCTQSTWSSWSTSSSWWKHN